MKGRWGQVLAGYNQAVKFGLMFSMPILGFVALGIFLDKKLGTIPWLTFILMFIGLAFGTYAIYRVSARQLKSSQNRRRR